MSSLQVMPLLLTESGNKEPDRLHMGLKTDIGQMSELLLVQVWTTVNLVCFVVAVFCLKPMKKTIKSVFHLL